MKRWVLALALLSSCGYQFVSSAKDPISLSIPFIAGDPEALLQTELTRSLASTGGFTVKPSGGEYTLVVSLEEDEDERVGFRYDRDNTEGTLEKNLLGVENRRHVKAKVSLIKASTGEELITDEAVKAFVVYDYTDPGSPRDLVFSEKQSVMQFSLGQLDSYEGAFDSSSKPVFMQLAKSIAGGVNGFFLYEKSD